MVCRYIDSLVKALISSLNFSAGACANVGLLATGDDFFTKGKDCILSSALASVVCMSTWLSQRDEFKMVTLGTDLILSIYTFDTGKSVLSSEIL